MEANLSQNVTTLLDEVLLPKTLVNKYTTLFAPDATRSVTGKQKHNKQRNKAKQNQEDKDVPSVDLSYVKLSDTAAPVH